MLKKKIWANFQRIIELFTQKIVNKLSKIMGLGSGIRKKPFRIPDPGVKKAPDLDPQHWSRKHQIPDTGFRVPQNCTIHIFSDPQVPGLRWRRWFNPL
jgi:hypothetical protein